MSTICARRCCEAGRRAGAPLTLAALATAAGFLSFLPTVYKGVSELGLIAGVGMLIAFATSITLLPALLSLLKPPSEPEQLGYAVLAPVDRFLERHRMPILDRHRCSSSLADCRCCTGCSFDFNPINLRSPKVEVGRDLSRAQERSGKRRQRHPGAGAVARRGRPDRGEAAGLAASRARR